MQLDSKAPRAGKKYAGYLLLAGLIAAGTWLTWAAQAETAPGTGNKTYDLMMVITSNLGAPISTNVQIGDGQTIALNGGEKDQWAGSIRLTDAGAGKVKMAISLLHADKKVGNPIVLAHVGELAKVRMTDDDAAFEIQLKANPVK